MELNQYTSQFPCYDVAELDKQSLNGVKPISTTLPYGKCFGTHKLVKKKLNKQGGDLFAISFMAGTEPVLNDTGDYCGQQVAVLVGFPIQYKGYRAWCYICQFKGDVCSVSA